MSDISDLIAEQEHIISATRRRIFEQRLTEVFFVALTWFLCSLSVLTALYLSAGAVKFFKALI